MTPTKENNLKTFHVIPVPLGWSVEKAWAYIQAGKTINESDVEWAVVDSRGIVVRT